MDQKILKRSQGARLSVIHATLEWERDFLLLFWLGFFFFFGGGGRGGGLSCGNNAHHAM